MNKTEFFELNSVIMHAMLRVISQLSYKRQLCCLELLFRSDKGVYPFRL